MFSAMKASTKSSGTSISSGGISDLLPTTIRGIFGTYNLTNGNQSAVSEKKEMNQKIDVEIVEKISSRVLNKNTEIDKDPDYEELLQQNPFEYKHPQNRAAVIQRAENYYKTALDLFNQGKYPEAKKDCEKALQIFSAHKDAKDLLQSIDEKLEIDKPEGEITQ